MFLRTVRTEAILLTKDYFEAKFDEAIALNYVKGGVEITCKDEKLFLDEMHDFIKRKAVIERTQTVKEIIIGRALYGLVEKCR